MHDPRALLSDDGAERLARRGHQLDRTALAALVARRRDALTERDSLRAQAKRLDRTDREQARRYRDRVRELDELVRAGEGELRAALLDIPNSPADEAPDGGAEDPPVVVREWGRRPELDFPVRDHLDLGESLGILDPIRARKLSGARFMVTRGAGARLERALASFLLDLHRSRGYIEHGLPHLVSAESMTATGQLPKFAEDLFGTGAADRELLLIPTAEVPLVNLHRGETLTPSSLPLMLTACTPCYRAEAGSYGRDTRGLIRLHQFEKVELVRVCHPDDAGTQLGRLVADAEAALRQLGLHYRLVELRAGDLGFGARRTFDVEVWLPGQDAYREISSCSDCGDFQSRRAGIRIGGTQRLHPTTLNGSALPIGRTVAAILEQCQQPDGSVAIPPALVRYTGFATIGAAPRDGATERVRAPAGGGVPG